MKHVTIAIAIPILAISLIVNLLAQETTSIYNGPYILDLTKTGATILWETHEPITGFVEYGTTTEYGMKTEESALTTQKFPILPSEDEFAFPTKIAPDSLVSGENVLAVGVWNRSPTSDLTLIVRLDLDDTTVINEGSPVKYIASSSDIPDWMNPTFDDSSWTDGISGVGDDDDEVNTEIEPAPSVYLRYRFDVKDASAVRDIYLFVDYDDGYVAWLNGAEISRSSNMTGLTPTWNTLAPSSHSSTGLDKGMPNNKRWGSKEGRVPIGTSYIHAVRLGDLTAGTEYHYRVHSGLPAATYAAQAGQDVSLDGRFKTAPDDVNASFRFAVYGDGRSHPDMHKLVADSALKDNPDFLIYVGDLVARGTNYSHWREQFFAPAADLFRNTPMFPVIGNHERGSSYESWYYRYLTEKNWYSFDYGNAHFVVLDSQRYGSKAQEEWLIQDLEANKDAKWLFVCFHYHVYSSKKRGVNMTIHDNWTPIFEKYGVDIVFSGHEHHYERSYRRGIYYIITGGGGAAIGDGSPMNQAHNPYKQIALYLNGHSTLDVYNDYAVLWTTAPSGKICDAVTIWAERAPDVRPPTRVRYLKAEPRAWGASLTWGAVADNDLIGYNIYRSGHEQATFQKLNRLPIKDTSFVDRNLMSDAYTYKVTAVDSWDNESKASVVKVTPQRPKTTYLTDLEMKSSDGKYRIDLDYSQDSIQLGDRVYNRGIGVLGMTTLVYDLAGHFNEFQANIGIDQSLGNDKSDVIFKALVDGKLAYESDVIKSDSGVQQVNISVKGAKELKLVVDGNGSDTDDYAVWADAKLIR